MRRGQDLVLGALLDHAAAVHHDDRVRDRLHGREVVGDEEVGDVGLVLDAQQQLQDAVGDQRVERRGDLVADDQVGLGGERARDADALLLAARELGRVALRELGLELDQLPPARPPGRGARPGPCRSRTRAGGR